MSLGASSYERCASGIGALGYTPRQADFLAHVALHGAHFLRRQYIAHTGSSHGLATVRFLQRLIDREHVRKLPFGRHGHVYHLCARAIYDACGLHGRRWGREGSWERSVEAVTTLDFVLAHHDVEFLATDDDKARALTDAGLERGAWPRTARGRRPPKASGDQHATFDHRPWYIDRVDRRLYLVYVESGTTPTGFQSFLVSHLFLLRGVRSGVAFVSQSAATVPIRKLFARVIQDERVLPRKLAADFLFYCRIRRAVDTNDFAPLSVKELRRFREVRPMFANRRSDDLYRSWLANSDALQARQDSSTGQDVDCLLRVHQAQALAISTHVQQKGEVG